MYKRRHKIRKVIGAVKTGILLSHAIDNAGISRPIWYQWERKFPRLKLLKEKALEFCDDIRTTKVEDAFLKKLTEGKGAASDYIFYLCNRAPQRWSNKHHIEHSGKVEGRPEKIIIHIENINKDKARDNSKNRLSKLLENND